MIIYFAIVLLIISSVETFSSNLSMSYLIIRLRLQLLWFLTVGLMHNNYIYYNYMSIIIIALL